MFMVSKVPIPKRYHAFPKYPSSNAVYGDQRNFPAFSLPISPNLSGKMGKHLRLIDHLGGTDAVFPKWFIVRSCRSRAVKQNIVIAAVTISWATWTSSTSTTGRLGWGLRAFEFAVFDHLEIQHCTMTKDVRWGATVQDSQRNKELTSWITFSY